jgi:hypothetical protein
MLSDAIISECGKYRYSLTRTWDGSLPVACFIGLNPSTADASKDDPTIRKCVGFARRWGCGGIEMVNLFAFRATQPSDMKKAADPVGPLNDLYVCEAAARCRPLVAAWGANGGFKGRDVGLLGLLRSSGREVACLKLTRDGFPWHPLYVPYASDPVPYLWHLWRKSE